MLTKLITVIVLAACMIVHAKAAALRNQDADVDAVFIEDAHTGQLRFLGNGFGSAQINQLITNKQNFLQQLRPAANWGTQTGNDDGTAINIAAGINIDTATNPATTIDNREVIAGTGAVGTATGVRVWPAVTSANRVNANRRRTPNRQPGNRRCCGNKRRRANNRPHIIVIQGP